MSEITATPGEMDAIAELRAEVLRLKGMIQRGPQAIQGPDHPVNAIAARDYQTMVGPNLDVVPRSHPLGFLEGASADRAARLKLEAVARQKGGRRDADPSIPSLYQGEWTPDLEYRWEFALGLRDDAPEQPLDQPEKPGSQYPNARDPRTERKRTGRLVAT